MLVLSRKEEQTIQIGANIQLTILKIDGRRVKIGIEAPTEVRVLRGELQSFVAEFESPSASDICTDLDLTCAS